MTLTVFGLHGAEWFEDGRTEMYMLGRDQSVWQALQSANLPLHQPARFDFHGTRRFITVFTSSRYWILNQSNLFHTFMPFFLKIQFHIFSSHLHLDIRSGLFPSDFLTKIWYDRHKVTELLKQRM
jgi:hypothetical protein